MVQENIDIVDLVGINLRYGSDATPLKEIALTEIVAKILYLAQKPLNKDELVKNIIKALGISKISKELVQKALESLLSEKKIQENGDKYYLRPEVRKEISRDNLRNNANLDKVISAHFPNTIKASRLKKWFNEALANFFGFFSDEWVSAVCNGVGLKNLKYKKIDEILKSSILKYGLKEQRQTLVNGFLAFLNSQTSSDLEQLMITGEAMFSSKLVAVDVGVDPLTVNSIKDSTILLDTNVLFVLNLEHHVLSKSIKKLIKTLADIGCKISYLDLTEEEYHGALRWVRKETLHLLDKFDARVVEKATSDIIQTAVQRGCKNKEDYERFFDSLVDLPEEVKGVKLRKEDDLAIQEGIEEGARDKSLKDKITSYVYKIRPDREPKKEHSLNHDSGLIHVVEKLRTNNEKIWVLSLDKTLQICAVERVAPHEYTTVVSVDALIEILAINNAGPGTSMRDFAPLLVNIILHQCAPPRDTFTPVDLRWLLSINKKAANLPPEQTIEMAKVITKARLEGVKQDSPKLRKLVNNTFEEKEIKYYKDLELAKHEKIEAEESERKIEMKKEIAEEALYDVYYKGFMSDALKKVIIHLFLKLTVCVAISVIIYLLSKVIIPKNWNPVEVFTYISSTSSFILPVYLWIPATLRQYKEDKDSSMSKAREKIKRLNSKQFESVS